MAILVVSNTQDILDVATAVEAVHGVPQTVTMRVYRALSHLVDYRAELVRAKALDARFGGRGSRRYLRDVVRLFASRAAAAREDIREFRECARAQGIDASAVIAALREVL